MATTGLEVKVGADVAGAVAGINDLNRSLATLGKGSLIAVAGFAALGAKAVFIDPLLTELEAGFADVKEQFIDSVDPMRKYTEEIANVSGAVIKNVSSVFQLVAALESGTLSSEQARLAQQKLVKEAPVFKDAFDKNGVAVQNLSDILTNSYIPALVNTIKINAATEIITKKLKKSFDAIAASGEPSKLQGLVNGFKNVGLVFNSAGFAADQTVTKYKNLKEAQDNLTNNNIQKVIEQTYKDLGISITDFGQSLDNTGKPISEHVKKLKEYKGAVDGIIASYIANNAALADQLKLQQELNNLQRKGGELRQSGGLPNGLSDLNDGSLKSSAIKLFSKEDLDQLQGVEENLSNFSDIINNGINLGIDQFFNAIANNQNPFEAITQSVKRLVVELGAAVVKALILKAISASISGGTSLGKDALGGLGKSTIRGNDITTALSRLAG